MRSLTRRDVVRVGGGAAATATVLHLSISTSTARTQDAVELRMSWWGGDARHEMYNTLLDLYEERNPGITIAREYTDWAPYWERTATQVAAGNPSDLLHFNLLYTGQYARQGIMLDLTPFVDTGTIDLTNHDQVLVDAGKVDGTLYYICLGASSPCAFYNEVLFEQAGLSAPPATWTWDDFVTTTTSASESLGDDVFGCSDAGGNGELMEIMLRQRGKSLVTENDELNFEAQDLIDWFGMWEDLRQTGAVPPVDLSLDIAAAGGVETSLISTGQSAMTFTNGNQLKIYQRTTEDELSIAFPPNGPEGSQPGNYIVAAFIGIAENSDAPEEAAKLINFMVNDPDAAQIYNAEHGPTSSMDVRELLFPNLDPSDQKVFSFMEELTETVAPMTPQPVYYAQLMALTTRTNEDIGFGTSVEEAVDNFVAEAERIVQQPS
ncbi:MAG: extracellular solute-binding protein [Chloroflexota bacterium]|nr:extracellular solute-binding protein [Chloroflexota bacterium]